MDSRTIYYLVYREPDGVAGSVFAVNIAQSSRLVPGKPRKLFRYDFEGCTPLRCYDMSANGARFLMNEPSVVRREPVTRMDLVVNWTATLPKNR